MSKKNDKQRKLVVKTETLRELLPGDLAQVQGGGGNKDRPGTNCTGRLSGCVTCPG